jgi:deoxycytidylate deaminase
MNRYYALALKVAETSENHLQRMGAVVVRGGSILSIAPNSPSTKVGILTVSKHAEERAIHKHGSYEGATIYVARSGGRMSQPCERCTALLVEKGFSYAVYATWNGEVLRQRVADLIPFIEKRYAR